MGWLQSGGGGGGSFGQFVRSEVRVMLRAVGIPAKFISGISYTNSDLFPENWGAHGWAEVYFPGYGWVPFDITYGEFGWIDPTHIKFKESIDSDEPSTYYQLIGRNADLKTRSLDIKTELMQKKGYVPPQLSIEASVLKNGISFGSYNLIEATLENLNDFYYANEVYLNKPKEVKIIGNELKSVLLLPREKKKVFWIVKLDNKLDSRYSYTFPITASTLNNISAETSFTADVRKEEVSFKEVEEIAELLEEEKQKKYSGNVLLGCNSTKSEFYEYEDAEVYCNAKNTGNIFLENVDICFENNCKKLSLGISQTKNISFEINKSDTGARESTVTLRNDIVSKTSYVNFKVHDIPKIDIEKIEYPANVSYNQNFTVSFTLAKKSQSSPKNVEIVFVLNGIEKKWSINELTENQKLVLNFAGSQLKYGKNRYAISVNYHDGLKKRYNANKEFSVELTNATIMQRLVLSITPVLDMFERVGYEKIAIMLLVSAVVFIIVIIVLFRRSKRY